MYEMNQFIRAIKKEWDNTKLESIMDAACEWCVTHGLDGHCDGHHCSVQDAYEAQVRLNDQFMMAYRNGQLRITRKNK